MGRLRIIPVLLLTLISQATAQETTNPLTTEAVKAQSQKHNKDMLFITSVALSENKSISQETAVKTGYIVYHASNDERFARFGFTQKELLFLLMGIIRVESNFNPTAASYARAVGLMQVHLPTWKIGEKNAKNIFYNVYFGKEILYNYLTETKGDLRSALHKYYGAKDDRYALKVLKKANLYAALYRNVFSRKESVQVKKEEKDS